MVGLKKTLVVAATALFLTACASHPNKRLNSAELVMVDKIWLTTDSVDNRGRHVFSNDKRVNNFYGTAEYKADGTFVMFTPEGKQKLAGDWSMSEDGRTRTLVAKDAQGKELFTRTVENVTVKPLEYTYRIYPQDNNRRQYIDIVHKPI